MSALLNRGVRLIKVSFQVNKGNKFGTSATVRLIEGVRLIRCPFNTGFTVRDSKTLSSMVSAFHAIGKC